MQRIKRRKLIQTHEYDNSPKHRENAHSYLFFFFFGLFRAEPVANGQTGDYSFLSVFVFFVFFFLRAVPVAHGSSQARGRIKATAAGLHHSHSNSGSELHLKPTPQLMATPDR